MEEVDNAFRQAVADGRIHGGVLLARDLTGKIDISRSYGVRSLREADPEKRPPMTADTPMRVMSCSKLLTSIMVLQCVEQGLVNLDEGLERLLPEIAGLKVLTGFDETGNPIEREPKSPVLLKHLLSHSSGLSYALSSPLLLKYREWQGLAPEPVYDTLDQNYKYPLLFDPGTSWAYGPSIDWCCRLIARASGISAEEFLQKHIVESLGIGADNMTFELQKHPNMQARRADMTYRGEGMLPAVPQGTNSTGALRYEDDARWYKDIEPHGGQGIYTTPEHYMKVLWSILSNDGKLLKPETRELLFKPALTPEAEKGMDDFCAQPENLAPCTPAPIAIRHSHSLGGMISLEDCDGDRWRRKGNLAWSGLTNNYWTIDEKVGICSISAFHLLPWADPVCVELTTKFEKAAFGMVKP
ncbi:Simvastatin synthase [Xylaria bambusicola]|uniref:Simvastatin synthase n=1 Tax=Xylaria bambusicola TaxID=326684 RepID=UPI002008C4E6|nr:Simvastatin synthase [Xylaria bambusicola]KAI0518168.1 Simvastatin synthase [Xylaria bambusicola]